MLVVIRALMMLALITATAAEAKPMKMEDFADELSRLRSRIRAVKCPAREVDELCDTKRFSLTSSVADLQERVDWASKKHAQGDFAYYDKEADALEAEMQDFAAECEAFIDKYQ